jgi:anti-sigma factor RsiW
MNEHNEIRGLLALCAAGALTQDEQQRLERHARECEACASELNEWQLLAGGLRRLPTPQPPAGLVEMTRGRVALQLAEREERRWDQGVVVAVVMFGWLLVVASWLVARFLSGSYLGWLSPGFARPWLGFSVYSGLIWLTGGIAAVMLGLRRRRERRTI